MCQTIKPQLLSNSEHSNLQELTFNLVMSEQLACLETRLLNLFCIHLLSIKSILGLQVFSQISLNTVDRLYVAVL